MKVGGQRPALAWCLVNSEFLLSSPVGYGLKPSALQQGHLLPPLSVSLMHSPYGRKRTGLWGLGLGPIRGAFPGTGLTLLACLYLSTFLIAVLYKAVSAPQRRRKTPACQPSTWLIILMPCLPATWSLRPHASHPPRLRLGSAMPLGLVTCAQLS